PAKGVGLGLPRRPFRVQYLPFGIEASYRSVGNSGSAGIVISGGGTRGAASVSSDKSQASEVARHIAREAARLFAARGYDATAVRAIVEAAGVTKPTLYYHFGSKEGLAQALVTVPLTGLVERLRSILAEAADPVAALEQTFEANFAFCRE